MNYVECEGPEGIVRAYTKSHIRCVVGEIFGEVESEEEDLGERF